MIITLNPKDKLVVRFEGTDGEFEIHFDSAELPQQLIVRETAGIGGNRTGVANSTLYHDDWTMTNQGWRNKPLTKPTTQAESKFDALCGASTPNLAQEDRKPYDQYLISVISAHADYPASRPVNEDLGIRYIAGKLKCTPGSHPSSRRTRAIWEALTDVQVRMPLMSYLRASSEQEGLGHKDAVTMRLLGKGYTPATVPQVFEDIVWVLGNTEPSEDGPEDDAGVDDWTMTQGWRNKPLTKPATQAESKFDALLGALTQESADRKPYDQYLVNLFDMYEREIDDTKLTQCMHLGVNHIEDKLHVGKRAQEAWEVLKHAALRQKIISYFDASESERLTIRSEVIAHLINKQGISATKAPRMFIDLIWAMGNDDPTEDDSFDESGPTDDDAAQ
jgi:hypothetical protein